MFSAGVLYSSQTLLEVVETGDLDTANFSRIRVADGQVVLSVAQTCRWLHILEDGTIRLTERGRHLRSLAAAEECLREQLLIS